MPTSIPANSYIYKCSREGKERKDTKLVSFFLCSSCLNKFIKILGKPEATSGYISGYCSYCNEKEKVANIHWFLCEVCQRVVNSFGREKAASKYILNFWLQNKLKNRKWKDVKLVVLDPATLRKYKQAKKVQFSDPDFIAINKSGKKLFFIEMKTGRNSIKDMSQFQLDKSDCDDIIAGAKKFKIPSYLFHVMVREEYHAPTCKHVALGAWWINTFDMLKAFKGVKMRDREKRIAAYFNKRSFNELGQFFMHLNSVEFNKLVVKSKKSVPRLYKIPKTK